jgi:hypothetical protein
MKVLFLTQGGREHPSSRYRVYQLLPALRQLGIEPTAVPLRSPADWRRAEDHDVVVVQKGLAPGLPALVERWLAAGKPMVFDFDDAIWLPREGGRRLFRWLHRERCVQTMLRRAAAVMAGNNYLAEYARRFNANVTVVPTAVDVNRYDSGRAEARPSVIGWIGSASTLAYLRPVQPVFERLGVPLRVIAAGNPPFPVEFRQWRLETELDELRQIGIGIAPMPDTPWTRGKCGLKVLQYMACGIPVVASPVGVHNELIQPGVNGFLAGSVDEWVDTLRRLQENAAQRRDLGQAGACMVRDRFNLPGAAETVAAVLRRVWH